MLFTKSKLPFLKFWLRIKKTIPLNSHLLSVVRNTCFGNLSKIWPSGDLRPFIKLLSCSRGHYGFVPNDINTQCWLVNTSLETTSFSKWSNQKKWDRHSWRRGLCESFGTSAHFHCAVALLQASIDYERKYTVLVNYKHISYLLYVVKEYICKFAVPRILKSRFGKSWPKSESVESLYW